jgi:hypothetical protein
MRTEKELRDVCTVIDQRIEYARGLRDAIDWTLGEHPGGDQMPDAAVYKPVIQASEYRQRTATQRPVIEILKAAEKPLAVSEIIRRAREQGHDLIRPSVQRALANAKELGLVRLAGRGRYYIPDQEGAR